MPPGHALREDVPQFFLPPRGAAGAIAYNPAVLGVAEVSFSSVKYGVTEQRRVSLLASMDDGPITLEWDRAERVELDPSALERGARDGATFGALPRAATNAKSYAAWTKAFQKWVVTNEQVTLFQSRALKGTSKPGESERDFRIRLQVIAHEARDAKIETLRGKYATKLSALAERLRRAEQAVAREEQQATQARTDSMISIGGALLGAVFGRGKVGVGTLGKVGTAARGMGRAAQQRSDVSRASESVEAVRAQYAELEVKLQAEIDALGASYDASTEELEPIVVKAKSGDVHVGLVALTWVPYRKDASGMVGAAWR